MSTATGPSRMTLVARVLLAAAMAAVAWSSLLPADDLPGVSVSDKVVHLTAYAVLGVLARTSGLAWVPAVVAIVAFGLILEVLQGASGYRSFEWADLVADAAGAAIGATVANVVAGARRRSP